MRVPRDPATYQHQDRREDRGNRGSQVTALATLTSFMTSTKTIVTNTISND